MEDTNFVSLSLEQRRIYCRQKIKNHSPPITKHDEFVIMVYKGLLDLHKEALGVEDFRSGLQE